MFRTRFKKEIVAEFLPPVRSGKKQKVIILCDGMPSIPTKQPLAEVLEARACLNAEERIPLPEEEADSLSDKEAVERMHAVGGGRQLRAASLRQKVHGAQDGRRAPGLEDQLMPSSKEMFAKVPYSLIEAMRTGNMTTGMLVTMTILNRWAD